MTLSFGTLGSGMLTTIVGIQMGTPVGVCGVRSISEKHDAEM